MTQQENRDQSINQREGSISNVAKVDIGLQGSTIAIVISLTLIIGGCGLVMGLNLAKQKQMDEDFNALRRQYERVFIVVTEQNAEAKVRKEK
jgi:hypothetical protein